MKKIALLGLLILTGFFISGCQQPSKRPAGGKLAPLAEEFVNVYYLAGKLNMLVSGSSERKITLTDGKNTVAIYPKEDYIYLNGSYLGTLGKTKKSDDMLLVRSSLAAQIKGELDKISPPPAAVPKPAPAKPAEKAWIPAGGQRIVLDAGHGGKDPGAISPNGFYEKTVNLDVALQLAEMLRHRGFNVITTRSRDTFIELEERAAIANRSRADIFVSIHSDSCANSGTNGFTIYVARQAGQKARILAGCIDDKMATTGIKSKGISEADFKVLKYTQCPAVLVELGYLSNYWEAKQLKDKNMQQKLAAAIADGITKYFSR